MASPPSKKRHDIIAILAIILFVADTVFSAFAILGAMGDKRMTILSWRIVSLVLFCVGLGLSMISLLVATCFNVYRYHSSKYCYPVQITLLTYAARTLIFALWILYIENKFTSDQISVLDSPSLEQNATVDLVFSYRLAMVYFTSTYVALIIPFMVVMFCAWAQEFPDTTKHHAKLAAKGSGTLYTQLPQSHNGAPSSYALINVNGQ